MDRKALIVDDNEMNREMLSFMLEDEYEIVEACDGIEALAKVDEHGESISAILLDIVMPNLDGFGVLEGLKERHLMSKIPVLVISATDTESERRCFEYGISDFIRKPFDERIVRKRVGVNADYYEYKLKLEQIVREKTAELMRQNQILSEQAIKLQESNTNIIEILGTVVEARNLESGQHIKRVKIYSEMIGYEMMKRFPEYDLTKEKVDRIVAASPLHDIGKILIPDAILLKPGKLDKDEWEIMKSHTTQGCELLDKVKDMWDEGYHKCSADICRWHHERYDGRGYPDGLKEDEIPVSAQIVSIADVYDALVNERPYKKAFSKEKAHDMIVNGECGTFSPKLIECFEALRPQMELFADGNGEE